MPQSAAQKFPWWSAGCGSIGERDVDGVMGHDGGSVLSPELLQHTRAAMESTAMCLLPSKVA